ncbi:hypothetical protein CA13_13700 [Planctomycetes bacterium CA13]|uniref:Lipoprotein n=1 Tax=Novipirellula herctigrandis TaxID=2527986 RepID=A0A5C5YXY6_9BACT|nr:hypothetical protein CA13_13700 [Planctomycetes bacterium CA13]
MKPIFHSLCALSMMVIASSGCIPSTSQPKSTESTTPGVTAEEATPRETLGKKTTTVVDLKEALAEGANRASMKIERANPLTQSASAYRTQVGKINSMAIHQAIQLRNAQSIQDPKPLTHQEFMDEIIKVGQPDGMRLSMLPYYQEYAWDYDSQELVVVEYPARKEEREKQR